MFHQKGVCAAADLFFRQQFLEDSKKNNHPAIGETDVLSPDLSPAMYVHTDTKNIT